MPAMPEPIPQEVLDAEDGGCFLFAPVDGSGSGYLVSGLTQAGLEPHALDGTRNLEELRLPDCVESLPDGAFADCPNLTRLVLEHTRRLCRVTRHTFDGAPQVKCYVPAAAYSLYRDGDGCERNQWAALLERVFRY